MALQKKLDLSTDQVMALGQGEGKVGEVKGYYLGSRTVATANGDSTIHVFQTPKGNVGVWGTAKLNSNLGASDLGVYQEIYYKGKIKIKGGKTQHTYDFNNDPENTIVVPNLSAGNVKTSTEVYDDSDDNSVDEDFNTNVTASGRTQQVSALLNKTNKQA